MGFGNVVVEEVLEEVCRMGSCRGSHTPDRPQRDRPREH